METHTIALFGATTQVGQRILHEALNRGHYVTAFVNDRKKIKTCHSNLRIEEGDISDPTGKQDINSRIKGHDVVINTYHINSKPEEHLNSIVLLVETVRRAGVKRLIAMGFPGNKDLEPQIPIPTTAEDWKAIAETQMDLLDFLENEKDIHWSYIHYPEMQDAVKKNSKPIVGTQMLVASAEGNHWFHAEKCAENVVDEAELIFEMH